MTTRHVSRSIALQTLFEWDTRSLSEGQLEESLLRNVQEFAPEMKDLSFSRKIVEGVAQHKKEIDDVLTAAAPEWPIARISVVDRNILRLGLYELLFADRNQVPPKVAINEAIELAKAYGGDSSRKFINGVLGTVYKQIGEPGKEEVSPKDKKKFKDVPYDEMPIKRLAGAVIFSKDETNNIYFAFVHDVFGHWTLSKGGLTENEDEKDGVRRVIKEELGLDITVYEELGKNEYIASDPEKGRMRKQVVYFLAESPFVDFTLMESGGLDDARWFKMADMVDLNFYDDILSIVTKSINIILEMEGKNKN